QAEGGIRDRNVTGVQTCALPILLEDQKLYFTPEVELFQDSVVRYYLDDSIFAITWKEVHDGSVYTFSEIKVSDPSQFRRHLAGRSEERRVVNKCRAGWTPEDTV